MSTTYDAAYQHAMQQLNAAFAADPFQRALDAGASWADVSEAYEAQQEARAAAEAAKPKTCPWAPKKAKRNRE